MLFEIRKCHAIVSLAALLGCGRVIGIATEQRIKAKAAPELRQAVSVQMISQRQTRTRAQTHTNKQER